MTSTGTAVAASALAFSLTAISLSSHAQQMTERASCHSVGPVAMEPLGGQNHFLQVSNYTCQVEAGPFKGAVLTGTTVWEHQAGTATARGGVGVMRSQDAAAVYDITDGQLKMTMQDGRPAGWSSSGKGTFTTGTGTAASFARKSIDWQARATGPVTFLLEWRTQ